MNDLLQILDEHSGRLVVIAGLPPQALSALRRRLAACLIQDNPEFVPIMSAPNVPPDLLQAAIEGAQLADELDAAGVRMRFIRQPYLAVESTADRRTEVHGPFIDDDGALMQFAFFETVPFRSVIARTELPFGDVTETFLLMPQHSGPDPVDPSVWNLPAGTVWMRADRLVDRAAGWAGLRIARGTLRFDDATAGDDGLEMPADAQWTLSVEPELPPAGTAAGSDGAAVTVLLPTELRVSSDVGPVVTGPLGMSGFGSALHFAARSGAAVATANAVVFPFDTGGATWSVTANRSPLFDLGADSVVVVAEAAWVVRLTAAPPDWFGEAAHGGAVRLRLGDGVRSRVADTAGDTRWRTAVLTADAYGIDLHAQADARVVVDLALWNASRTTVRIGGGTVPTGWRHASRRGGPDVVTVEHAGRLVDRWDLPRAASGAPFAFDGAVEMLSLIAGTDGRRLAAVAASRSPDPEEVHGYVLANLFLHVRAANRAAVVGSGPSWGELTDGRLQLVFDVRLAQPTLPDPYAASWNVRHLDVPDTVSGLSAVVAWTDDGPTVTSTLRRPVTLPEPAQPDDPPDPESDLAAASAAALFAASGSHLDLLDVSGRDHQWGVALEATPPAAWTVEHNLLRWPMSRVRLLMQPQVHWEPVQVVANPKVLSVGERVESSTQGGPTLVGVTNDVELVPVLPGRAGFEMISGADGSHSFGALFGLPFGLHAFVTIPRGEDTETARVTANLHEPVFTGDSENVFTAARQLRLLATGHDLPGGRTDPSRTMSGVLWQTPNLRANNGHLPSVLSTEVASVVNESFEQDVPLHHVDLSGYGLSTFSRWRRALPEDGPEMTGVTQVRFDVVVGRTSYEVIELQSRLWHPQSRVVRTIILERGNSGTVRRYDSGWKSIDVGTCQRYARIATGVVADYRNIRNIRIVETPLIHIGTEWTWQEVRYDADLRLVADPAADPDGHTVPIRDHTGYVQISPVDPPQVAATKPTAHDFAKLMAAVGHPIGGQIDATVRLGGTLAMHLSHLEVAAAPHPGATVPQFMLAASGVPALPRAGQWTAVAIDGPTKDVAPVDPRRGLPVIRREGDTDFVFRDAADAYVADSGFTEYGFLMATPSARVLFPGPRVNPGTRGRLSTAAPLIADPCALAQASGIFPRPPFALRCAEQARFAVSADDHWTLTDSGFTFTPPVPDLVQGAGWGIERLFPLARQAVVGIDSVASADSWKLELQQPDELRLRVDPFGTIVTIRSTFATRSGGVPGFDSPTVVFGPELEDLLEIVDVLGKFVELGFTIDVDVSTGSWPNPSFLVDLALHLRLPAQRDGRVDIGVGKLRGSFDLTGRLQVTPSGATTGRLTVELSGDVQQAIIPRVAYAGGQFRFVAQITDGGTPKIEAGLGVVASIGGDLIKNLVELEATVHYGYMLVPETLQPAVLLGIEARAKLLAGLLGLSFSADAMARIDRVDEKAVTLSAELRVAATVQVAVLIEEEWEIRTRFRQEIPLAAFALIAGAPFPVVAATEIIGEAV